MSKVRSDNISNRADDGAPALVYGAEVPVGYGITGAGGINITGVATAASFSGNLTGNATGLTGTPDITINNLVGVAATFTGVLTYEDVTNIDSIGIITARSGVSIADSIFHTGDTNTAIRFPAADTFTVETAGSEALRVDSSGNVRIGNGGIVGALSVQAETNGNLHIRDISDVIGSGTGVALDVLNDAANSVADLALRGATTVFRNASGETLRIDSRGSFLFSNGFLSETVRINTTARTGTQAVYLNAGNVHYFTSASTGTWKPNFALSTTPDINDTIATGDTFSVTMIVLKGATSHFANSAELDGSTIGTIEFLGGAPTDGGGSGTYDVYNYTIIKTGDNTFIAFVSVSNYE